MMNYARYIREDRRLIALRVLAEAPGHTINHFVLHTILGALGHCLSRDQVRGECAWLAEQGLVTVAEHGQDDAAIAVITLTQRGDDVAAGRVTVPGVKRPTPGVDYPPQDISRGGA